MEGNGSVEELRDDDEAGGLFNEEDNDDIEIEEQQLISILK